MRLTVRGAGVLSAAVVMVVAAALFGIEELYALAGVAVVVVAASAWWVRRCPWDLRSARSVVPSRVPAGSDALVELAVRNRSSRRSPIIALRDSFGGGRSSAALAVAPLRPGETVRATYRVPTTVRGVYTIGPLELELADPFGLVATVRQGVEPSPLIVHPRLVDLHAPRRSAGMEAVNDDTWLTSRSRGGELSTIREYRTGDDLRRVHWASTARLDELMVRQDEAAVDGRLVVALDLRPETWAAGGLDTALSVAGSVAAAALGTGVGCRLVTSTGADTGDGAGPAHRSSILDLLAAAQPGERADTAASTGADRLLDVCAAGSAILITGASPPGLDLIASPRAGTRAMTAVVVLSHPGAARPDDLLAPRPGVEVIDSIEALAASWRSGWASISC